MGLVPADVQCRSRTMDYRNVAAEGNSWMRKPGQRKLFQGKLLNWYDLNRRDMPWRQIQDPYRIWISEIMLQQTRVATVIPHYYKFVQRFPSVDKLAAARESSVLAVWSGLGYYRRARMMHAASKTVVNQFAGKFPDSRDELMTLPGIGRYTSAAIASIAYGEAVAVVDGNVRRVIERLMGRPVVDGQTWQIAEQLLCRHNPGNFNQALMELGATVCLPGEPKCTVCPVRKECASRGSIGKTKTTSRQIKRTICYTFDRRNGSVFLVKRSDNATLMPSMWELPESAEPTLASDSWMTLRHSITITDYKVHVVQDSVPTETSGAWVKKSRVAALPLTGLARKILRAANVI